MKLLIAICMISAPFVSAIAEEEKNWGADISLGKQYQEYELVSADMQSLTFSPYYQSSNWTVTATLPWMKINGDYFINGYVPRIVSLCSRLSDLTATVTQRLLSRGHITTEQISRCGQLNNVVDNAEESQSGLADATLAIDYLHLWGVTESWWTSVGVEYKADNGDGPEYPQSEYGVDLTFSF